MTDYRSYGLMEVQRRANIKANHAKYWLGKKRPDVAELTRKRMLGSKASEETKRKMSEAHQRRLKGHIYTNPMKTRTAYGDIHKWVSRKAGKPQFCEHCLTKENRMYHWANVNGEYLRDLSDWVRLCVPCHKNMIYRGLNNGN